MKITGCTQSQLAMKMGKSQSSIANKIRLLNLDDNIQNAVSSKIITERHARALIGVENEKQQEFLEHNTSFVFLFHQHELAHLPLQKESLFRYLS